MIKIVEDNSLLICDNTNDNFENLWLSNRMNSSPKSAKIVKFEVFPRQKNENHVYNVLIKCLKDKITLKAGL